MARVIAALRCVRAHLSGALVELRGVEHELQLLAPCNAACQLLGDTQGGGALPLRQALR